MTRKRSRKPAKRAPKKTGRPSVFREEEHCRVAHEMLGNGKTLNEIAQVFGVNRSTIQDWQRDHPAFSLAVTQGREDACDRVEASLFQRATGYEQPTEKLLVVSGGQGMGSMVERHNTLTHVPADVAAARFFLTNRRPADWKERQEVKHEGTITLERLLAEAGKPPATTTEPATTGEKPA